MREWPGLSLEDAMPLRFTGGLHNLYLSGMAPGLGAVYRQELTDQAAIDALVAELVAAHDHELAGWFDGPPQTNEAGRSASVMVQLLWLSQRLGPRFELLELGASAGINTMMERFHFDLGGGAGTVDDAGHIAGATQAAARTRALQNARLGVELNGHITTPVDGPVRDQTG